MGLLSALKKALKSTSDVASDIDLTFGTTLVYKDAENVNDEVTQNVQDIPHDGTVSPTSSNTPSIERLVKFGWDVDRLTHKEARSIIIKAIPGHSHESLSRRSRKDLIQHIERLIHWWLSNVPEEQQLPQLRENPRPEPEDQQNILFHPSNRGDIPRNSDRVFLPREYFSPYEIELGKKAVQVKVIGAGGYGTVYQVSPLLQN